jgi:carboxylesterase 2
VPILFGALNSSTATSAEVELSQSLQTAFANFAKNPDSSPAPHWPPYEPEVSGKADTPTLAKIAYQGNVDCEDFVQPVQPDSTVSTRNDDAKFSWFIYEFLVDKQDGPCSLWDTFLDYRP